MALSRDISLCCECVQERYRRIVDALDVEHIFLSTISTLRTPDQQKDLIASGVSWTRRSKHLPQPPKGLSLAIDLCPVEYLHMKGWNPTGAYWQELGRVGESLGMRWGGRWVQRDMGHLELAKCLCGEAP
jgi:hypothetical protein